MQTLRKVIQSLDDARTNALTGRSAATIHVPFRESKLTRLLQPYFVDGYVVRIGSEGEVESERLCVSTLNFPRQYFPQFTLQVQVAAFNIFESQKH